MDHRENTSITYSSAIRKYHFFCRGLGVEQGGKHITERQLCEMCWLFCHSCKHTGLDSWVSAIADYHEKHNFPKLPRGKYYQRTKKSLANVFGQIDVRAPAVPISERQLLAIALLLDPNDIDHAEFWLACLMGFQGLLRASEFCDGALSWANLRAIQHGMRITIPFSKTKLTPTAISVGSRTDRLNIFTAVADVLRLKPAADPSEPVISLSYSQFNGMLKRFYEQAFGTCLGISSHSLRRGGTSAMVAAGVPEEIIMRQGRWSSRAWREYIDLTAAQQLAATRALQRGFVL
jgi:integrase